MAKKVKLEVVAGLPGKRVIISKGKKPRALYFNVPLKLFKQYEVESIEWEEKTTRSAGKAAVGAAAGGILTGGLGFLAGAALGGKKKDISTAVITLEEGPTVYVRCSGDDYTTLNNLLL